VPGAGEGEGGAKVGSGFVKGELEGLRNGDIVGPKPFQLLTGRGEEVEPPPVVPVEPAPGGEAVAVLDAVLDGEAEEVAVLVAVLLESADEMILVEPLPVEPL